jgi:drug/metabolite transporter (DMT)-like permease
MLGIALALGSSVVWGSADFLGGIYTRRLSLAGVVVVSQMAGLLVLLAIVAATGGPAALNGEAFAIGLAAGGFGAVGIAAFYAALAAGTMSIVSPVSACGAVIPMALALLGGERPGATALAGAVVALSGAVMASIHEYSGGRPGGRSSILLAVLAAAGIGGYLFCIGHAARGGHTLEALLGGRTGSLGLLILASLLSSRSMRVPRDALLAVAAIGLMDTSANALFAVATQHGYLSIVSVLGSVYPIVTVLLAQIVLRERLTTVQAAGVVTTLVGVAIVSAG